MQTLMAAGPLAGLDANPFIAAIGGMVGLVLFSFIVLVAKCYRRCPSNRVLVIYGKVGGGNTARCIHGGASFIWPVLQDYAYLSLEPIQIEVPLRDALSLENIRLTVPSVFTIAIGTEPETMQNAAIRLLGLNTAQVKQQAQDIIFGQLRQVIASMRIEDINRDREKFLHSIQNSLEPELRKIGVVLINVNITDINDESGYIKAIGQKAASQAVQQARGDVAEQEKLGEIRVADAEREKSVQVASARKLREIGMREAQQEQAVRLAQLDKEQKVGEQMAEFEREAQIKEAQRQQAVRVAQLDKEQKIGEQTAVYEREAQVKDAERQMRIQIADANAKAIAGEATAQAQVVATRAALQVKEAEAFQLGETRRREAEAAVQEAQNRALAKAAIAEAERVEAERRAQLEAPAKAEKARVIVDAQAAAERRRIEAEAEAAATFARLSAEARGQYEMLAKKGEGLERIIEACGGAPQAFQLLMLEHLDKLADTAAKAISNIKFDKVVVWEGAGGNGASTASFLQSMARTLPPMMQVMKDIGGMAMPDGWGKIDEEPAQVAAPIPAPAAAPGAAAAAPAPKVTDGAGRGDLR